ncbi:tRNA pseudouridine(55) synthase TruB [Granulicoccus sp. GXG6511]|uniref:tRNA pseudouridine(55) synthase TruB n=1 Tax=Granulicoccus sp. GXG6511 TaxID=3381351 RepID=UPI003D7C3F78
MTDSVGIAVVDKLPGWTSHQVVGRCRRILGTRKVGHAGTLDPMATGVLVIGVNRATRLLGHLMLTEKEYAATIRLGITTVTDDAEGDLTGAPGAAGLEEPAVRAAIPAFTGDILQIPTAVSAIKVDGKRAYARVRAGEDVTLQSRPVTVHAFDLHEVRPGMAEGVHVLDCDVTVRCSSGTYIRALARDLGARLGTGGHLTALRRTRVGPFGLDRAHVVDADSDALPLLSLDDVVPECFDTLEVDERAAAAIRYGQRLPGVPLSGLTALLDRGRFLALYRPDGQDAVPEAVFV